MARRRRKPLIDCTFCGDEQVPAGREHVFPIWIAKKLAASAMRHHVDDTPPQFVDYSYRTLGDLSADETGDAAFHQTKTGEIPAAHQARNVCKQCNEGWLSRLEHAARLVLSGLLEGTPKVLTPYDQFTIGTWIIKTSCMYDAALAHRLIPEEVGTRQLFTRGYAIQHSLAVIAHDPTIVPMGELLHAREPLRPPGFPDTTAVKFGFQFDHLVVFAIINLR